MEVAGSLRAELAAPRASDGRAGRARLDGWTFSSMKHAGDDEVAREDDGGGDPPESACL